MMKKLVKNIPNILTLCNLLCGLFGIVLLFSNELKLAAFIVFISAIFDFADGFFAEILNAKSKFGGELDSLADMVSFGVLPGLILFFMINHGNGLAGKEFFSHNSLSYLAFLIPIFSAIRLAKFNTIKTQSVFLGLPTPATAIFIASLLLITTISKQSSLGIYDFIKELLQQRIFLLFVVFIFSFLMVWQRPMLSLKFQNYNWANNKTRYLFLIIALVCLLFFGVFSFPIIIFLYIIMSLVFIKYESSLKSNNTEFSSTFYHDPKG